MMRCTSGAWAIVLAITCAAEAAAQPAKLVVCIDDSSSIRGYTRPSTPFFRLWTEYLDSVYTSIGFSSFQSCLVGDTVRPGPPLSAISSFAGPGRYGQRETALLDFFSDTDKFPSFAQGSRDVAILVSDMEPSVTHPRPECTGNGSVSCLQRALEHLIDAGWVFWIIGVSNPFEGKRYYYQVDASGRFHETFETLHGQKVPFYVVVASRTPEPASAVASAFYKSMRNQSGIAASDIRLIQITGLALPPASIDFESLASPLQSWREANGRITVRQHADIAFRRGEVHENPTEIELRVANDVHQVSVDLPVTTTYPPGDYVPDFAWDIGLEASGSPGIAAHMQPLQVTHSQPSGRGVIQLDITPTALKASASRVQILTLKLQAKHGDFVRGAPFSDWSYHSSTEQGFIQKTFRTGEIFSAMARRDMSRRGTALTIASLRLKLTRR